MSRSCRVLVVGLGNRDRGDDAAGLIAAKKIEQRFAGTVSVIESGADAVDLIAQWTDFDAVICIDAAAQIARPGRIHRFDLAAADLPRDMCRASTHTMGLVETIALARALDRAPRDLIIYAIEGAAFARGAAVTPDVGSAIAEVVDCVVTDIRRLQENSHSASGELLSTSWPAR